MLQYFLPQEKDSINGLIEQAILAADTQGVRVISLGALNKVSPGSNSCFLCVLLAQSLQTHAQASVVCPETRPTVCIGLYCVP